MVLATSGDAEAIGKLFAIVFFGLMLLVVALAGVGLAKLIVATVEQAAYVFRLVRDYYRNLPR
jgi:hypothetical protein